MKPFSHLIMKFPTHESPLLILKSLTMVGMVLHSTFLEKIYNSSRIISTNKSCQLQLQNEGLKESVSRFKKNPIITIVLNRVTLQCLERLYQDQKEREFQSLSNISGNLRDWGHFEYESVLSGVLDQVPCTQTLMQSTVSCDCISPTIWYVQKESTNYQQ